MDVENKATVMSVKMDIGGTIFRISEASLHKFPDTLLGSLSKSSEYYNDTDGSYNFDRNPEYFNFVLDLYRTGSLHMPHNVCGKAFQNELEFWKIPYKYLGECCLSEFFKYENDMASMKYINHSFDQLDYTDEECIGSRYKWCMRKLWLTLDQPLSSWSARVITYFCFHYLTIIV